VGASGVKASLFAHDRLGSFSAVRHPLPAIKQFEQLVTRTSLTGGGSMLDSFWNACRDDEAQDIAEYAVMLAVILVLVVGTIRLVGSNANNVFSSVASSVH
jgi:Flp pilus assembly pilin Flp